MPGLGKRILICEDNRSIQTLLRFYFEKRGYEIRLLEDGTEAVAAAVEFGPDLILLDVIMPGKDGIETCADLRREGVKTPIVILTSKDFEEDKERGLAAGADAYLHKPFNPKKLEEIIGPLLLR